MGRNLVSVRHWFYHSSNHLAYHIVLWRNSPFAFVYYQCSRYPSSSCFLPKKHRPLGRCLANPIYSVLYKKENASDDYFNRSQMPSGLFCSGASNKEPIRSSPSVRWWRRFIWRHWGQEAQTSNRWNHCGTHAGQYRTSCANTLFQCMTLSLSSVSTHTYSHCCYVTHPVTDSWRGAQAVLALCNM